MGYRKLGRPALCLALGAALLLGVSPAWAQTVSEGKITGTVYLPTGEAVAGATARVTGDAIVAGERTVVSGEGGRFVFLSLPPGSYDVAISMDGFKTFAQENIAITSGATVDVKATLEMGAIEETVVVTSESPIVDTRSSTIDTTFTSELLESLPTSRDSFYDLALTAAGMANVGKEGEGGWLNSPSAYGSAANDNIFLIDGVNTTNPRGGAYGSMVNVNYNMVEEVKVLSLGSRAEYGSFSGAAFDVLTKSGGNEFHGDVAYYSRLDNADNQPSGTGSGLFYWYEGDDLTTNTEDDWEAAVTVGGPIVKDRLWFYVGYDKKSASTDTPIYVPLIEYRADIWDVKLTSDIAQNHRLWVGYHNENTDNLNGSWGDTWDETMTYDTNWKNETMSGQYTWVASDRNLVSAKYLGFNADAYPSIPATVGHPGYINWWKLVAGNLGVAGDFPYVEAEKSSRSTMQADFQHYADDFLGSHDVKFGVQYTEAEANWLGGYFQGYANFAYPAQWWYGDYGTGYWEMYNRQYFVNPWLTVRKADSMGAFVDDQWVVSDRITLNLGLRYDSMSAKYGDGLVYEMPTSPDDINNPTVLRTREGTGDIYDFKTWSPRLGVAWTVTGDGKTVLRAHIGRYYAPIGVESLRRFGPDMQPLQQYYEWYRVPWDVADADGDGMISIDENRAATRMLADMEPYRVDDYGLSDPSWDLNVAGGTGSPYTDQFNISLQRQIGRDFAFEVSYIYKKTEDILALNAVDPGTGEYYEWEGVPWTTAAGEETTVYQIVLEDYNGDGAADWNDAVYVLNNVDYEAANFTSFEGTDVKRTYQGVQLVLTKRYSNRWQGLASFNWTDSDGVAPRTVDQNWYIEGPMIHDTPFGSTVNHYVNNLSGPVLMTPEFMFKLGGSYRIPLIETDAGLRIRYDSGRPLFMVEELPRLAEWMGGFDGGELLSTGSDRIVSSTDNDWLPSSTVVDLSLNKDFNIGQNFGIGLSLDILNAFNENSPSKVGFYPGEYGRVYNVIYPRTTRLGVKFFF
jgi:outer membrane receptor protein involved in Fe transport